MPAYMSIFTQAILTKQVHSEHWPICSTPALAERGLYETTLFILNHAVTRLSKELRKTQHPEYFPISTNH